MIIFTPSNSRVFEGLGAAFKVCYPTGAIIWKPEVKPIFDMCAELRPEILFLDAAYITTDIIEAIEHFKLDVVLHANGCSPELLPYIKLLIYDSDIPEHMRQHLPTDVLTYEHKPAANYVKFRNPVYNDKLIADIGYLSTSGQQASTDILERLSYVISETPYSLKIMGSPMPYVNYIGITTPKQHLDLAASTQISLDCGGHLLMEYAVNRIFTITNVVQDVFPYVEKTEDLLPALNQYIENPKLRAKIAKQAYKQTIDTDTCFHRLADIAQLLDKKDWYHKSIDVFKTMRT